MSSENIKDRQAGNVTVLDIEGDLRMGGGSDDLRKALSRLLLEGQTRILLNFAQVPYIDSSGLGELIAGRIKLDEKGGQLKLLKLTRRVRELMHITKLLTVFDIYEDEPEALASFDSYGLALTEHQPAIIKEARYETHP